MDPPYSKRLAIGELRQKLRERSDLIISGDNMLNKMDAKDSRIQTGSQGILQQESRVNVDKTCSKNIMISDFDQYDDFVKFAHQGRLGRHNSESRLNQQKATANSVNVVHQEIQGNTNYNMTRVNEPNSDNFIGDTPGAQNEYCPQM